MSIMELRQLFVLLTKLMQETEIQRREYPAVDETRRAVAQRVLLLEMK